MGWTQASKVVGSGRKVRLEIDASDWRSIKGGSTVGYPSDSLASCSLE